MKQVLQSYKTGELRVADVAAPQASPGTVLVRTRCSLVSTGTERMALELARKSLAGKAMERPDLVQKVVDKMVKDGPVATARAVFQQLEQPLPLGYSAMGVVVALGEGVQTRTMGERVACAGAKVASHAEFNAVPVQLCVPVPDAVTDEAAAFATLGAIALQGVRTANLTLGERVGVIGLGLIGQLAAQLVRANGCRVVGIDLDAQRVALAKSLGADLALMREDDVAAEVARFTEGRGLDAILLTAATDSDDPVALAGQLSRDRGRVVVVGAMPMNIPRRPYYDKELAVLQSRSYGPGRYDATYEERGVDYPLGYVRWTLARNLSAFLEQCAEGRVQTAPLITHRFAVSDAENAYRVVSGEAKTPSLGVLLTYDAHAPLSHAIELERASLSLAGQPGISVLGTGQFAGSVLGPLLAKRSDIRRCTATSARGVSALAFAERFRFAQSSTDVDATLSAAGTDGVVIATRHHLHAKQVVVALQAGKAVYVEKPLALDEPSLLEVAREAISSGRPLMVGFNRREAPLFKSLKAFMGETGQPAMWSYRINAGRVPAGSWLNDPDAGGGRLLGEVCHFIDLIADGSDAEVERVMASAVRGATDGVRPDEQIVMTLELSTGAVGTILYTSEGNPALPKERLEVHGGGRSAVLDDFKTLALHHGRRAKNERSFSKDKGHAASLDAFVRAVASGKSPQSLRSLMSTTCAALAALQSLRTGEPVLVRPRVDALLERARA
ncbi:MAG: bi-domain-containing oxidoreductase [Myxococcaceae bacterium]